MYQQRSLHDFPYADHFELWTFLTYAFTTVDSLYDPAVLADLPQKQTKTMRNEGGYAKLSTIQLQLRLCAQQVVSSRFEFESGEVFEWQI